MTTRSNAPGPANWRWLGEGVQYAGAHKRVKKLRSSASGHPCAHCSGPAADWAYDHLDAAELLCPDRRLLYSAKPEHYLPLCKSCHGRLDQWRDQTCPQGHARTPENTYVTPKTGWRSCLPCRRERSLSWQKVNRIRPPRETLRCQDCDLEWTRERKVGTKPPRCNACKRIHDLARQRVANRVQYLKRKAVNPHG